MSKPILYKANETDFRTLGLGVLADELGTLAIEERNGQFYLEMEYPVNGKHFKELKNDRIIKADSGNDLKDQRFKIIRITKPAKGTVKVYAEHISNLSADKQLRPNVSYSGNAQSALNIWGNNITDEHPFTFHSDITTTGSGRWEVDEVDNARRALGGVQGSILDTYGGEYRFDNYHISLLRQRGNDNGISIMYGKNLIDLEQEEEIASTYTSIYPYATHHPEGAEEFEIITLPELVIDSEHVDKYAHRKILKVNFTADEIDTVEQLRTRTQRYITENDVGVPKVNLRVKFVDLAKTLDYKNTALIEEINLCDWVTVYFDKLGIRQRAKVIKTVWNVSLDRYEEIEIGEARANLTQSIDSVVDGRVEQVQEQINVVRVAANGKNKNHWGFNEPLPQDSKEGDTWFKPIGDGEEEIYRYNGYMWAFVLSTADTTLNKEAIEAVQADLATEKERIDGVVEEIDVAVSNAGFTSLSDSLTGIQSIANTAQANSISAIGDAQDAMNTASTALGNAQTALDGVDQLNSSVSSIDVRVDEVEGTLELKADSQTVDVLTGRVDTAETNIGINAQGLALKAEQSTVDTLAGTVSSLGTDVGVVAGQISSKVWMSDIDDIEVGVRNLIVSSEVENAKYVDSGGSIINGSTHFLTGYIPVKENETYTISMLLEEGGYSRLSYYDEEKQFIRRQLDHNKPVIHISPDRDGYIRWSPDAIDSYREGFQIEKGTVATDWTPAPEDTDAKIDYIQTEWTQTFDRFSQTVSSLDGRVSIQEQTLTSHTQTIATIETDLDGKVEVAEYNTLVSTVSSSIQRIVDAEGNITQIEASINGIQTTVAGKASQLQVTQLDNLYNVLVTDFDNMEIGGRNYFSARTYSTQYESGYGYDENGGLIIKEVDSSAINAWHIADLEPNTEYVFHFSQPMNDRFEIPSDYKDWSNNGKELRFKTSYGEDLELRGKFYPVEQNYPMTVFVMLEKGNKATDWTPAPEDMATQAQISVLSNNINLRVEKGDVLSQINLEAGSALIETGKLLISAESTVISGTAFISGAVIQDASIDTAQIADLAVSSAKIASLDVNKISGNSTEFVQSWWNIAVGGNVSIDGGGVRTVDQHGDTAYLRDGGLDFFDWQGRDVGSIGVGYEVNSYKRTVGIYLEDNSIFKLSKKGNFGGEQTDNQSSVYSNVFGLTSDNDFYMNVPFYVKSHRLSSIQESGYNTLQIRSAGRWTLGAGTQTQLSGATGAVTSHVTITTPGLVISGSGGHSIFNSNDTIILETNRFSVISRSGVNFMIGNPYSKNLSIFADMNMNGHTISNSPSMSDARLKTNVQELEESTLDRLMDVEYVDFNWIKDGRYDVGFIAQQVKDVFPEIMLNAAGGFLGYNNETYTNLLGHSIQELALRESNTNKVASQALHLAEDTDILALSNKTEIDILKEENEALKNRIEELEGTVA